MKKLTTLGFVLCLTSTAAFADLTQGDGTYLPKKEFKSSVSRDAVIAKTDSRNLGNSMDSTYAPSTTASSNSGVMPVREQAITACCGPRAAAVTRIITGSWQAAMG